MEPLFRGATRLGPRYLADSVREANHTRLGYRIKLSRLCFLDPPPLSTSRSQECHPVAQDLEQEKDHRPLGRMQVPQVGLAMAGLHSLN
jgi:hypothetical protein